MNLRQLHYFKEIVDQGSISKASEVLHIAQPPLSIALKQMEEYYGMPLINRYRKKWEVTAAGKMLYEHAVNMLKQMEMFDVKMKYVAQGEAGELQLGVSSSCIHLVGDIIQHFTEMYPHVQLQLIRADSEKLERMLFENKIDIAIILAPETIAEYESISLPSSPFALAVPLVWYEQFSNETFSIQQIQQYPFVSLEAMEGYFMLENMMNHFTRENINLHIVTKCKDISIAQYLVAKEVGISILPNIQLGYANQIRFIHLPDLDIAIQPKLFYKKEAALSPICRNFIAQFK